VVVLVGTGGARGGQGGEELAATAAALVNDRASTGLWGQWWVLRLRRRRGSLSRTQRGYEGYDARARK
jgi:hypothetical protein